MVVVGPRIVIESKKQPELPRNEEVKSHARMARQTPCKYNYLNTHVKNALRMHTYLNRFEFAEERRNRDDRLRSQAGVHIASAQGHMQHSLTNKLII